MRFQKKARYLVQWDQTKRSVNWPFCTTAREQQLLEVISSSFCVCYLINLFDLVRNLR